MASNYFGNIFRITTWGESHGLAVGVIIDGCPSNLEINEEDINKELALRACGRPYTSRRKEEDRAEILSGVFEGRTTGAPISIIIKNRDVDSSPYLKIKDILRPSHSNFTYMQKYGHFDYLGGGRASGRETACRVAAAAIADKLLRYFDIEVLAYIRSVGGIEAKIDDKDIKSKILKSPLFCPDMEATQKMLKLLKEIEKEGDSIGGVVEFRVDNIPSSLGEPVYERLDANLARAMFSIPAVKGFEIGEGFFSSTMMGSSFNDQYFFEGGRFYTKTNNCGGVLGGISNGMPLIGRVAFKPTPTILKEQSTVDIEGKMTTLAIGKVKRDICVAIRGAAVVRAMCLLVLADFILANKTSRIDL